MILKDKELHIRDKVSWLHIKESPYDFVNFHVNRLYIRTISVCDKNINMIYFEFLELYLNIPKQLEFIDDKTSKIE